MFEKSPLAAGVGEGLEVGMGELEGRETKEEADVIARAGDCEAQAGQSLQDWREGDRC